MFAVQLGRPAKLCVCVCVRARVCVCVCVCWGGYMWKGEMGPRDHRLGAPDSGGGYLMANLVVVRGPYTKFLKALGRGPSSTSPA